MEYVENYDYEHEQSSFHCVAAWAFRAANFFLTESQTLCGRPIFVGQCAITCANAQELPCASAASLAVSNSIQNPSFIGEAVEAHTPASRDRPLLHPSHI